MNLLGKALLVGALLALCLGAFTARAEAPKHILVLYDEDKGLPGLARIDSTLRESFRSQLGNGIQIHSESLALSRFEAPGYDALVADFFRRKYADTPLDLVVAVMEPSLDFLLRNRETLFSGIPIVFCGVDASSIKGKAIPPDVTGLLVKRSFSPTLEVALRLQPGTRNVYVAGGSSTFDRYLESLLRRDLQPFEGRVAITYLFGQPMDAWLERVSKLPAHSVVLFTTAFADVSGRRFVPHEALSMIANAANAPVYVFLDQYVGLGAVGGNVYSTEMLGAEAAELGLKILAGASPSSIPIRELGTQVDMFDARQLRRWNLDEARLPPGSIIRFQAPAAWELYRGYIISASVVLLIQAALIGGLLIARTRQRRAEAEARQQRDHLAHVLRVTTLGELSASVAHEISQPLGAIRLNAEAAQFALARELPPDSKMLESALADIMESADYATHVVERLRKLARKEKVELAPVEVATVIGNVVRLVGAAKLTDGIDIRLGLAEPLPAVFGDPVQLEQVLLNIVVNACDAINASTDGPRVISIRARPQESGRVLVQVIDSGIGFAEGELERMFEHFVSTKPKGLGMGLAITRSIITAHGGLVWATANADRGLTVHVELPASVGGARTAVRPLADNAVSFSVAPP